MRRLGAVWLLFGVCCALAAGAMARLGSTALALERAEAEARRQAALEEDLQLALWRMDSALAPLMAEESARPYFAYSPLYPAERAYTRMFAEIRRGEVLVPSPLLAFDSPRVRIHFQYGPDGRLSSPQVPSGVLRALAESRYLTPERFERASRRFHDLAGLVNNKALAAALAVGEPIAVAVEAPPPAYGAAWESKISNEYAMRSRNKIVAQNVAQERGAPSATPSAVNQGPLQAVWVGPALLLARRVHVQEGVFIQGCWLDWDVIRNDLVASVADLMPGAALVPVRAPGGEARARMLASLPARLIPGAATGETEPHWSPLRLSLLVAWACLTVAAAAVALMLHGALALSERRGTFVSAVTHELRTPLTTFRLYTEMLDEGMVTGPEAQRSYMRTLRSEADRLGHLVENVLAYARLERGRAADNREVVTSAELFDRLAPRLATRAQQAGKALVIDPRGIEVSVRVDVSVVEQILSNLVDNAVKYASGAADARIHLRAEASGRWLELTVRDHGPGLPPRALRRLFRPFSKSAHDAAHSAPGVGLGLALSRRLARALGGDLRLQDNGPLGVCFVLTLALA